MWTSIDWAPVATFAGVTGFVLVLLHLLRRGDARMDLRIDDLSAFASDGERPRERDDARRTAWSRLVDRLAAPLLPRDAAGRTELQRRLMQAGYYSPAAPGLYVTGRLLCPVLLAAAAVAVSSVWLRNSFDWLLLGGMAGCIGYLLPGRWLDTRTAARRRVLNRSLPDFLDLLVTCLEAGLSFEAAIQRVTGELSFAHPLLGGELLRVQREIELGAAPDRAFQNFAERTDADMVRNLAMVLHQARRFGTRVAAALRVQADVLRTEREHIAEETAQKAAVKILFPTIFCLFPAIFVVLAGPAAIEIAQNFSGEGSTTEQAVEEHR